MEEVYDVLIIGGGPAGLTASLYSSRYNLKTLVISKSTGGTANLAPEIENWPGFMGSGMELMKKFREQAESFGAKKADGLDDLLKSSKIVVMCVGHNQILDELRSKDLSEKVFFDPRNLMPEMKSRVEKYVGLSV